MGYLRLFLSLVIMGTHLVAGATPHTYSALCGFYILSGYSITARGTGGQFWRSRFWRLWPIYAVIAAATQIALWFGWVSGLPHIGIAQGWSAVAQTAMIVPTFPSLSLVPGAWVIRWLLLGYLLMWLGASKTPQRSGLWLLFAMAIAPAFLAKYGFERYYTSAFCALLFTAGGACLWHLGIVLPRDGRWAAWAGALSYPVFLCHYLTGSATAGVLGLERGWPLFFASLPLTLALSLALVVAVEQPIAVFRKTLRSNHG